MLCPPNGCHGSMRRNKLRALKPDDTTVRRQTHDSLRIWGLGKNSGRLYIPGHRRRQIRGISKTNDESVRLKGRLQKLQFRSPRYRPGHTCFVPSNPTGVPITGPRANIDRVVYSNWSRNHRFPSEKITPGPSDYNPNYNNPNEQYVYVKRVQPYGIKEVVD